MCVVTSRAAFFGLYFGTPDVFKLPRGLGGPKRPYESIVGIGL